MRVPRELAVRVLTQVLSERRPLDEVMEKMACEVEVNQRAWVQEVCQGTLRWKGRLDLVVDSIALKKKPSGWLRRVLLLATYQLIAQDRTLAPIVVSETVDLVKQKEGEAPARFVNALLRKVAAHSQEWRELSGHTAGWASLPLWMWDAFVHHYGLEWTKEYSLASLERPFIWIRVREGCEESFSVSDWAEEGPIPGSWKIRQGGGIQAKPGFHEGAFFVQDISSQFLVFEVTKKVRAIFPGFSSFRVLDLCGAPGGKAAGLAWNGFQVHATDKDEGRLRLLRQTIQRVAPQVEVLSRFDASAQGDFDLVWVDAPCSGSGIVRRHPDIRWLRRAEELKALKETQMGLLREGWEKVRSGGFLVYSVCSLLEEEGETLFSSTELLNARVVQKWLLAPHLGFGGDGFWAVMLEKEAPAKCNQLNCTEK